VITLASGFDADLFLMSSFDPRRAPS